MPATFPSHEPENWDVIDVGHNDGTVMLRLTHNDGSKSTTTVPKELISSEYLD